MERAKDIYNTDTWTDQDRQFLDLVQKLNPEEMDFISDFMQLIEADPEKSSARADFAEQQAGNYKLKTAEGRAAFMKALKAV